MRQNQNLFIYMLLESNYVHFYGTRQSCSFHIKQMCEKIPWSTLENLKENLIKIFAH